MELKSTKNRKKIFDFDSNFSHFFLFTFETRDVVEFDFSVEIGRLSDDEFGKSPQIIGFLFVEKPVQVE